MTGLFRGCPLILYLSFNETKVTLRHPFIGNLFVLESKKGSKYYERNFFQDYRQILDWNLNLQTANATYV